MGLKFIRKKIINHAVNEGCFKIVKLELFVKNFTNFVKCCINFTNICKQV